MTTPLNRRLYGLLKDRFGQVRISNEGIAQVGMYRRNPLSGRDSLELVEPGEYYQLCCPFCNDTRFRLYINHMWGRKDELGRRNLWMAICYNENCLNDERRLNLWEDLNDPDAPALDAARILPGKEVDPSEIVMDWPGSVTRVDRLPGSHKAVQYLLSRNFDPKVIGKFYNVHYCHNSMRWLAQDRLIIPIYLDKVMKGWQGRYIGETDGHRDGAPIKYYTCPGTPRRLLVYNLRNAANYETGVIMEGPTDAWSFGPMGVCTLGSTMTTPQIRRFTRAFKRYPAVLLYDPDVREDRKKWPGVEKMVSRLRAALPAGLAVVWLPRGRDPRSLDRAFMWQYVAAEARKQGVEVSWKRR